ncbi:hypothetical protein ACFL5L_05825 [candidate division KSB1 bacterium]
MQTTIPLPDALPLPAPVWLFMLLLYVTFLIHVIFMNILFGGTFIAGVSYIRGKHDQRHLILAKKIYSFLPVAIAFTVNFGIAPLLFVQVLYGNFMYSSSILMAVAWISVIPLVILGYYGTYTLRFKWDKFMKFRTFLIICIPLVFAAVAFMFVNNMTLMLKPETWLRHYFVNPSVVRRGGLPQIPPHVPRGARRCRALGHDYR